MTDELVAYGDPVKALPDGKVGGYLVKFSTATDPDITGDYFTPETDFGEAQALPVLYHHGYDKAIGRKRIGRAELRVDDVGIWAEAQLTMRNEYERKVYELAEAGALGWSSGTAGHVIDAEAGKARRITQWFLTEASLTPTPAEPRNHVVPLKSLLVAGEEEQPMTEQIDMEALKTTMAETAAVAAVEAVKAYMSAQEQATSPGVLEVVEDEADRALKGNPFKSNGEFLSAVKNAALMPETIDKRLLPLKALGANEAIPSQGGFLVPPAVAAGIRQLMYPVGSLMARVNWTPVSGNGMTFNGLDETLRTKGYRYGGISAYWMAEGGTKTATKPKFRQIDLKLKKLAALCYATDELLEDAGALESWLSRTVPEALRFEVEDTMINGDGVGKPLGILGHPSLVSAVRTDANEIDSLDVARMWQRRHPAYGDYVWLCNANIFVQLVQMSIANQPVYVPPMTGYSTTPYGTLFGRPVIETEYNPALGTLGDILLIAPSALLAIEKSGGIQTASSIHVQFVTDETAFRFVGRWDWAPELASAITPHKGTDTISPFVALAAST